jgi:hypothetical protein
MFVNCNLKIYINGALQTVTLVNGTNDLTPYTSTDFNNTNPFRIGSYTQGGGVLPSGFLNGLVEEFIVWNRVLTASEVTELQTKYYPY